MLFSCHFRGFDFRSDYSEDDVPGAAMKQNEFDPWRSVAAASGAGLTLLSCIGVGVFLGVQCDRFFDTSPWGLIVLSLLGAFSGIWAVVRQMMGR